MVFFDSFIKISCISLSVLFLFAIFIYFHETDGFSFSFQLDFRGFFFTPLQKGTKGSNPKCKAWRQITENARNCILNRMKNLNLHRQLPQIVRTCTNLLDETLRIAYLSNTDDRKSIIPFSNQNSLLKCTSVTLGIGNDTLVEEQRL